MSEILLSFIIPIYNTEDYLESCVDGIISQNTENIEIILVDDGSSDNSPVICDNYSEKYDFVKVIHKPNSGAADSRNVGIRKAVGKYILFVDSDDCLYDGSVSRIINTIRQKDADIIFLDSEKVFSNGSVLPTGFDYNEEALNSGNRNVALNSLLFMNKYPMAPWDKVFKTSLIRDNEIYFVTGFIPEDIDFVRRAIFNAQSFAYCKGKHYGYRQAREGAVTTKPSVKKVNGLTTIVETWTELANGTDENYTEFKSGLLNSAAYVYQILLRNYALLPKEDRKQFYSRIAKHKNLLSCRKGKLSKCVNIFSSVFGINATSGLLKNYILLRNSMISK